jgi:hypothetical protein
MPAIDQGRQSAMNSALNDPGFEEMIGIYSASVDTIRQAACGLD